MQACSILRTANDHPIHDPNTHAHHLQVFCSCDPPLGYSSLFFLAWQVLQQEVAKARASAGSAHQEVSVAQAALQQVRILLASHVTQLGGASGHLLLPLSEPD